MKANEAPEKIYLQVCGDCQDNECDNCKFEDLEDNVTWCKDKIFDKDIEYIRADAFIEKAKKWMLTHTYMFQSMEEVDLYIEMFIKEMKGEEVCQTID